MQTDVLNAVHPSILLAPITTELRMLPAFRIPIVAQPGNGLREASEIMADKLVAIPREGIRQVVGSIDAETQQRLDDALAVVLGLRAP